MSFRHIIAVLKPLKVLCGLFQGADKMERQISAPAGTGRYGQKQYQQPPDTKMGRIGRFVNI